MPSQQLRVAWLGPAHGGLGWLQRQLAKTCSAIPSIEVHQFPAADKSTMQKILDEGGVDRVLCACSTRVDYPREAIEFSLRNYPEVPLAVACESWWDGSRRSGIGILPHLSLPWYRWWDGWSVWLEGCAPELFGPCQNSPAPWIGSSWLAQSTVCLAETSRSHALGDGLVVGNCRQTCNAWQQLAAQAMQRAHPGDFRRESEVEVVSWARYQTRLQNNDFPHKASWILWDDSCLDTSAASARSSATVEKFFELTAQVLETSLLIAALSLPRAHQWLAKPGSDHRHEFIVKPDSGQALIRLLQYHIGNFAVRK